MAADSSAKVKRMAGRPPAKAGTNIDRASIIATALAMSKDTPLQNLSIVLVAKRMSVAPALLHYYLGGRDALTSGVMNAFYKIILQDWPAPSGRAEDDILIAIRALYDHFCIYPGIVSYTLLNNRFRIFQDVGEGELDYGVRVLERFTYEVMKAGHSAERTGLYAHMLLNFAISSAYDRSAHRAPGEHREFLKTRTDQLDPRNFPAITFTRDSLVNLDAEAAFMEGCKVFLTGLRGECEAATTRFVQDRR